MLLDVAELDAVPPDLDLAVASPEEVQQQVLVPHAQIPGAVPASAVERREALRGELGPVQIAGGEAGAADPQLARHPGRAVPAVPVRHAVGLAPQRLAVGHGPPVPAQVVGAGHEVQIRPDAPLGGPAHCGQDAAGRDPRHPLAQPRVDPVAGAQAGPQRQPLVRTGRRAEHLGEGGRGVPDGDAVLGDEPQPGEGVAALVLVDADQGAAGRQRAEDVEDAQVEVERRDAQDAVPWTQRQPPRHVLDRVGGGGVAHEHALGLPGGARGVDRVGAVVGPGRADGVAGGGVGPHRRLDEPPVDGDAEPGGGDDGPPARRRQLDGQRQIGAAAVERAEDGHDLLGALRQADADELARAGHRCQPMGDPAGGLVEPPVAHLVGAPIVVPQQRRGPRLLLDVTHEQLVQSAPGQGIGRVERLAPGLQLGGQAHQLVQARPGPLRVQLGDPHDGLVEAVEHERPGAVARAERAVAHVEGDLHPVAVELDHLGVEGHLRGGGSGHLLPAEDAGHGGGEDRGLGVVGEDEGRHAAVPVRAGLPQFVEGAGAAQQSAAQFPGDSRGRLVEIPAGVDRCPDGVDAGAVGDLAPAATHVQTGQRDDELVGGRPARQHRLVEGQQEDRFARAEPCGESAEALPVLPVEPPAVAGDPCAGDAVVGHAQIRWFGQRSGVLLDRVQPAFPGRGQLLPELGEPDARELLVVRELLDHPDDSVDVGDGQRDDDVDDRLVRRPGHLDGPGLAVLDVQDAAVQAVADPSPDAVGLLLRGRRIVHHHRRGGQVVLAQQAR